ncbi:MAG: hypothetical protein PVI40_02710 [Chlamydiota bacterium]|jgi:hypothetical protein
MATTSLNQVSDSSGFYQAGKKFFGDQISKRIQAAIFVPISLIANIFYTSIAVGAIVLSFATCDKSLLTATFSPSRGFTENARGIIAHPYNCLLKTLNPNAKIPDLEKDSSKTPSGIISELILKTKPFESAMHCFNSKSFFKRHIVLRLTVALLAVTTVIIRIADGVIGIGAASLSFLTFGKISTINNIAFRAFQAPIIIMEFTSLSLGIINPKMFFPTE